MKRSPEGVWLEIEVARAGAEVNVAGRGSREERSKSHPLGPEVTLDSLERFADRVRQAAARGYPLGEHLAEAQAIHRALLRGGIDRVRAGLREAARGGPLLVRLMISDLRLQAIPWEAACNPESALGFLASSPDLHVARGVSSEQPWVPREVRGALRILAIAPTGGASSERIQEALSERIASGEIEWLDPIGPDKARSPHHLLERLRRAPIPHVLHFLGHGGIQNGKPFLQLADDLDGEAARLPVELIAQHLKTSDEIRARLRLIVLEACEGAQPGVFASAAELLAEAGADAVVAHLWPVRADVARLCSQQFYGALAGAAQRSGDVARSLNEARRAILADPRFPESAEAFSPVLYLRGNHSALFDFKHRKVAPPVAPRPGPCGALASIDPALERLLHGGPFSLVLGDRWKHERTELDTFRQKLRSSLRDEVEPPRSGLPMSALTQRFAFRYGAERLTREFKKIFPPDFTSSYLVPPFARLLGPGVHVTLLRSPFLEEALATHHPARTVYVIQPGDQWLRLQRPAGSDSWEELSDLPGSLDLDEDIVVLRLYSGYTPDKDFIPPLLTEDDYLLRVREFRDLEGAMGRDVADAIQSTLANRPALLLGLSIHTWHHRVVLHRLFGGRPLPLGSLCGIEPDDAERELWKNGASLPGRCGVAVVEAPADEIAAWLEALAPEGALPPLDLQPEPPSLRRAS